MACPHCKEQNTMRKPDGNHYYTCGYSNNGSRQTPCTRALPKALTTKVTKAVMAEVAKEMADQIDAIQKKCTCDLFMFAGCTCGAFKREQAAKQHKE